MIWYKFWLILLFSGIGLECSNYAPTKRNSPLGCHALLMIAIIALQSIYLPIYLSINQSIYLSAVLCQSSLSFSFCCSIPMISGVVHYLFTICCYLLPSLYKFIAAIALKCIYIRHWQLFMHYLFSICYHLLSCFLVLHVYHCFTIYLPSIDLYFSNSYSTVVSIDS